MKKLLVTAILASVSLFLITACQSQPEVASEIEKQTDDPALAVPYSRGPTSPPAVKGPDAPPPGGILSDPQVNGETAGGETPQAVTETDDVTITFPSGEPSGSPDVPPQI